MNALRQVPRTPGYSLAFIASLAIGIAATCTSFAVVKRAFFDPLPYPDPDRLVTIRTVVDGETSIASSYQFGEQLRDLGVFADVSADWGETVTYEAPGASERLPAGAVTPNYFAVIGAAPALGATLTPGATDEVVVSWAFFQRALDSDSRRLGSVIVLDGTVHRIVGVMPSGFVSPYLTEAQLWIPLDVEPFLSERSRGDLGVLLQARLAEGVSLPTARAALDAFGARQRGQYPDAYDRQTWAVDRLHDVLVEPSYGLLVATAAATALLTLIVLVNIAGLSAARAADARRAHAVRLALGASPARLFRAHLTGSVLLAAIGAASGAWLASSFIDWVVGYQQQFQLFLEDVPAARFDLPVAALGVLLAMAAALVAAVVSQRMAGVPTAEDLLGSARVFGHAKSSRLRAALVVTQVAVAVMLVFSAGLLVRTMQHIDGAALGFESGDLAQFTVTLPASRYDGGARVPQFEREVLERLRAVGGVDGATAALRMPALGGPLVPITLPGRIEPERTRPVYFAVAPGFFEFLRVPLRDGREFARTDTADAPSVVVINESMARTFWPDGRAVGTRFRLGGRAETDREVTVIGIVADVRQDGPAREARPTVYETTQQRATLSRAFVFRLSQPLAAAARDVRASVLGVDPLLATSTIEPLAVRIDSQVVQQRFVRSLLVIFAAIAAGLCALGLFAVVSLNAEARRREFALRMALGARARQVVWLVLRHAMVLGIAGGTVGVLAASWFAAALQAMVIGVSHRDPVTIAGTALALLAVTGLAAAPSALRTTRIDPARVLRAE